MHRRWLVNKTNPEYINYLSRTASVSPVLSQILVNRGLKTAEEIYSFLNPNISQLSDPFDLDGMRPAVERIISALKNGERILIHGDYDADGLTSTAIVLKALRVLGIDSHYFIPHRMEHGYGFNSPAIRKAKELGATLIITVDCGITSLETAALCKKEGIDVIITDHHEPLKGSGSAFSFQRSASDPEGTGIRIPDDFILPEAVAVINPKISHPQSSLANLSGAGIAFKLVHALAISNSAGLVLNDFLDLAAIGTIADIVPMTGENRIIAREGLKLMEEGVKSGLRALKNVAGIDGKPLKTGLLLFTIIPRINAAGRVSHARDVVKLLLAETEDEAIGIASWLDKLNAERQQTEEGVYQEALIKLRSRDLRPVIVLSSEGWHRGVIGIVASRITEEFHRPTFIISIDGNIARGSARSIPSFDVYKALTGCREFLTGFGGHRQAAGLELEAGNIDAFDDRINSIGHETLADKDVTPLLEIDADVSFSEISFNLTREMGMLEPFGTGNPEPLLGAKGLEVLYPKIVKNNHLKMKLRQKGQSIDAIGFNMASYLEKLEGSATVDAAFTPCENEWEGSRSIQLYLKALRPSR